MPTITSLFKRHLGILHENHIRGPVGSFCTVSPDPKGAFRNSPSSSVYPTAVLTLGTPLSFPFAALRDSGLSECVHP